jgi:tellurite resistance protein TehA-like permease
VARLYAGNKRRHWQLQLSLCDYRSTRRIHPSQNSSSAAKTMPAFAHSTNSTLRLLPRQAWAWLGNEITALGPGCFAMVMATGIVSNALFVHGYRKLSGLMFEANALAYVWLAILTILRSVRMPQAVWLDLTNPHLVFSFFTLVASNGVVGAGIHLRGPDAAALDLWLLALFTWFVLFYFSFGLLTFRNTAHIANVVHGGWLIAIVGTESLVILGTDIAPSTGGLSPSVFVLIHMLWGLGIGLYSIFITLFAYRIFFFAVSPKDLTPVLWVVMGAAAISANAGSTLILTGSGIPFLHSMRAFIDGATFIIWAWATWWIPLLLLFGIWKHCICRVHLSYTPMLWSAVFPLGMYSVATLRLSLVADFPLLRTISLAMVWISLASWAATFIGLAISSWRSFRQFTRSVSRQPAAPV